MDQVRLGVIGCGGMGQNHMRRYYSELSRFRFVAASDPSAQNLKTVVDTYGIEGFDNSETMLDSGAINAVFVATPHYHHPTYAIAAMKRGLHVLTEKPVAVTARAAANVNDVYRRHPELVYAVMFQLRAMPKWQKLYQLIQNGELGKIQRMQWTATRMFRSQAYYDSGAWRATWAGEGGGILMNQCPHNLDMLCRLFGVPRRVTAHVGLGRYHDIEVEDEVTALLEFDNGSTGVFISSTGESPGTDRLEIIGDRGRITVSTDMVEPIAFDKTSVSVREFNYNTDSRMGEPPVEHRLIESPEGVSHRAITENFIEAILDGVSLLSPGEEGLHSIELANAILMSGIEDRPIEIPMDRDAYEHFLKELIGKTKAKV